MTDGAPNDPTPNDPTQSDPTQSDPTQSDPTQNAAASAKGLTGWFQRRVDAMLRTPGRASAALTEPGDCHVVLQVTGATPVRVIKVICQATGLDLLSAHDLAQDAPVVVVSGISEASAERVVGRLQKAGARAVAGEPYRP